MILNKTAAIRAATGSVGIIYGRGSRWHYNDVLGKRDDLSWPSTPHNASSYAAAREARTEYVANLALHLMGYDGACTAGIGGHVSARVSEWLRRYAHFSTRRDV